jgi:hypothetical protein
VPAEWNSFQVNNERVGNEALDFAYSRSDDEITLHVRRTGPGDCTLEFSPAVSLRARIVGLDVNGRPASFRAQATAEDQHVRVRFTVFDGDNTVRIRLRNDFELEVANALPPLGARSRALKFISQSWNTDRSALTVQLAGVAGQEYDLALRGARQIASVSSAKVVQLPGGAAGLRVSFPAADRSEYETATVIIHFNSRRTGQ